MIVHCSLWKFKSGTTPALVQEIAQAWRELVGRVPSVRKIEVGPDLGNWPENYDLAALVYFDAAEGYEDYRADEVHLAFAHKYLLPNVEGLGMRAAVQFELPSGIAL